MNHRFPHVCVALIGLLLSATLRAQAPDKMSYQAVVRDAGNNLVTDQPIGMRISILQGSPTGTAVYVETHTPASNSNGLVSLEIGGGTAVSGSMAAIDWALGPFYLKSETDPTGGTSYSITGTSQLISVPYALYSSSSGSSIPGPQGPPGPAGPGLQDGTVTGQLRYWNGSTWALLDPGTQAQVLTICDGVPVWTNGGVCPGGLGALDCANANMSGTLLQGVGANNVSFTVPYTGGDGGSYNAQNIQSSGVSGLIAAIGAGTFANGAGTLTYTIVGTPATGGTASFQLNIGGQSCTVPIDVDADIAGQYPAGTVFCVAGPTPIVEVTTATGRIWMDRNLGASQVATSSSDFAASGSLYQWGRSSDGHQCWPTPTTTTISNSPTPGHGDYILAPAGLSDWLSPQSNGLWQGVDGTNNPCPNGFRLPTIAEWEAERQTWSSSNSAGAFASPLKLTTTGSRSYIDGSFNASDFGFYWASTVAGTNARYLGFAGLSATTGNNNPRAAGMACRCIKN